MTLLLHSHKFQIPETHNKLFQKLVQYLKVMAYLLLNLHTIEHLNLQHINHLRLEVLIDRIIVDQLQEVPDFRLLLKPLSSMGLYKFQQFDLRNKYHLSKLLSLLKVYLQTEKCTIVNSHLLLLNHQLLDYLMGRIIGLH